jgi:hypothetical protein
MVKFSSVSMKVSGSESNMQDIKPNSNEKVFTHDVTDKAEWYMVST